MGSEIRLFTIALHLADSYINDASFTTKSWSEASKLPANEIATMQREALMFLNWNIYISKEEFELWIEEIIFFSGILNKSFDSILMDCNNQQIQLILSLWPSSTSLRTILYPSPQNLPEQNLQVPCFHQNNWKSALNYHHSTKQIQNFNYRIVNYSAIRKLPFIRTQNQKSRIVDHMKL
ncbi:hypothetical protein HK096_010993, partial [Nowakowskiella sp. JEL0078]